MPENYSVEELLLDESFIRFCLFPGSEGSKNWEQLIIDNVISRETLEEAKSILHMLTPGLCPTEISDEITRMRGILNDEHRLPGDGYLLPDTQKNKRNPGRIFLYASIVSIFLVAVYVFSRPTQAKTPVALVQFETKTGEQKKIVLPDGTYVILNSNTTFSYDKGYNDKDRKVQLSGRAFFKVSKNPSKPFSVYSTHFATTAIGTSFYVSGDSSDDYSVRLLEGKVKLNSTDDHKSAVLDAGQEAVWQGSNKTFVKENYDTLYLNNWLSGKIVFYKTPTTEAFSILEKWYGVEIIDKRKEKLNIAINGTYENVLLEDILKVICFSLNCNMNYENKKIIIQ